MCVFCFLVNTVCLCVFPLLAPTSSPTNVSAVPSGQAILVSWSPPPCKDVNSKTGLTGYQIQLRTENVDWEVIATITDPSVRNFSVTTDIRMLVLYDLRVGAMNNVNVGPYNNPPVGATVTTTIGEYNENYFDGHNSLAGQTLYGIADTSWADIVWYSRH